MKAYESLLKIYHKVKKSWGIAFLTASVCAVLEDNYVTPLWVVGVLGGAMVAFAITAGVMHFRIGRK